MESILFGAFMSNLKTFSFKFYIFFCTLLFHPQNSLSLNPKPLDMPTTDNRTSSASLLTFSNISSQMKLVLPHASQILSPFNFLLKGKSLSPLGSHHLILGFITCKFSVYDS